MIQAVYNTNKGMFTLAAIVLMAAIVLFVFTSSALALLLPVVFLFLALSAFNWKIAFWALLFSMPFSIPVDVIEGVISTTIPDEPVMWIFTLLLVLLVANNPRILPQWWFRHPVTFIVALQFVCLVIAVIYSQVFLLSVKFLLAKIWMLSAFFVLPVLVIREKKDFITALRVLLLSLLITVIVIGVRHANHGFQFSAINAACSIFYYNHVEYAAVISTFFPLTLVALPLVKNMSVTTRFVLLIIVVVLAAAIFLSFARSAVLGVVFALMVGVAIRMRLVNWVLPFFYGLIVLLTIYLVKDYTYIRYRPNYDQTYMRKNYDQHIEATLQGQDMSTMERIYRWVAAARMSTVHPLTGFGPHSFTFYYKTYAAEEFRTYVSANNERSTTHNYFLYMLTEQGWIAMILYGILNIVVLARAQKIYHRFKDRFYKNCTLGIAMMFAVSFVNNFFSELIETHKAGALFYLSLALLIILSEKCRQEKEGPLHTSG